MTATLRVKRDEKWVAKFRGLKLYVDDKQVESLKAGQTKEFSLPAGPHSVRAQMDWAKGSTIIELREGESTLAIVSAGGIVQGTINSFLPWKWSRFWQFEVSPDRPG